MDVQFLPDVSDFPRPDRSTSAPLHDARPLPARLVGRYERTVVIHPSSIRSPAAADPGSSPNDPAHSPELDAVVPISLTVRLVTLFGVIVPFLGLAAAVSLLWGWGFSWVPLGLLIGMYVAPALGVTVGFHRLFTHRSFETNAVVKFI